MNLPEKIQPSEVLRYAEEYMNANEISHHGNGYGMDDLYLKVTPVSREIVSRLTTKSLLTRFVDNIEGKLWYELPFCYNRVTAEW